MRTIFTNEQAQLGADSVCDSLFWQPSETPLVWTSSMLSVAAGPDATCGVDASGIVICTPFSNGGFFNFCSLILEPLAAQPVLVER